MEWLIENPKDGTPLAPIPEGEFLSEGKSGDEGGGEPFLVGLPGYYLALHPVRNAQYARFLTEVGPSKPDLETWVLFDADCLVRAQGRGYEAYGEEALPPSPALSEGEQAPAAREAGTILAEDIATASSIERRRGAGNAKSLYMSTMNIDNRRFPECPREANCPAETSQHSGGCCERRRRRFRFYGARSSAHASAFRLRRWFPARPGSGRWE
jgi:hypothetical protein